MKLLKKFLIGCNLVACPKKRATAVNNSTLSLLKSRLLGQVDKVWNSDFFIVGSEVHKRSLEPKKKPKRFIKAKELLIRGMVQALLANNVFVNLLAGAIVEKKLKGVVLGVKMHGTLDINRPDKETIADIKTTSAKSQSECLKSCINYGYFRQAIVYMTLAKAKNFIFIFVTKSAPHKIFFINVKDYPTEMSVALEELKFLLHFYKTYGMVNPVKLNEKKDNTEGTGRRATPTKVKKTSRNARTRRTA